MKHSDKIKTKQHIFQKTPSLKKFLLFLLLLIGTIGTWAQTDYSGTYYIASVGYNSANTTTNYYLCPTEGWCCYQATDDFTGTDNGMPFLTTYRCRNGVYDNKKAIWTIEKAPAPNDDYYYIKQASTGRYLTSNGTIRTTGNADRMRVHLEAVASADLNDKELFTIDFSNNKYFISPKGVSGGAANRIWLVVNGGNQNALTGQAGKQNGPTGYENTAGIIGIYTKDDNNAPFYLEPAPTITPVPTITNNFDGTITITGTGTIYYTTDGTEPNTSSATYSTAITLTDAITVIKAIAKDGTNFESPIVMYEIPQCETPVITVSGGTVTITTATAGASIHYTTDDTPPTPSSTLYNSPFAIGSASTIRAIAVKAGCINSEEGYYMDYQTVSSSSEITNMRGAYLLADGFNSSAAIGTASQPFRGIINGQMNTISGLSHSLVAYADGAIIKNVILDNVSISGGTNVGAICNEATGSTRIYNCGVLATSSTVAKDEDGYDRISSCSSTVSGSGYVGGIVGLLDGSSRVINCFSYANVSGGSHVGGIVGYNNVATTAANLKTMVMNCMFYGEVSGSSIAPIYNGEIITNVGQNTGVSNFNYFRLESSYIQNTGITKVYNCALGAETRFLQRFEFFRHLLNSNRELAAWWATDNAAKKDEMMKWVMEPSQIGSSTPYPILKTSGKYASVVNYTPSETAYDESHRNEGLKLTDIGSSGTLSVTIQNGSGGATGASITTSSLDLTITDKDFEHFNFNYGKVQLPYYNDVGTNNYTGGKVVTGWKIVSITGGTAGSYSTGDDVTYNSTTGELTATPYNFADRKCTNKDLYGTGGSNRVFNQGAYWDVPEGVTAITIQPYWGKAVYLADEYYDVVYNDVMTSPYNVTTVGGGQHYNNGVSTFNGQLVYTTMANAVTALNPSGTVYDNAVVLVGNYHEYSGNNQTIRSGKPYTVTSIDLDGDNEPDYSFMWRFDGRTKLHPVRYDFLNLIGLGMAQKSTGGTGSYNLGIPQPLNWFEVTNTALFRVTQFEYSPDNRNKTPIILQGGVIEQWVTQQKDAGDRVSYFHVGGNVWFKEFHRGSHQDNANKYTPHPPLSVTGGDFAKFYLTGLYQSQAAIYDDNAECYINGGRFGEVAGAGMEGIGTSDGKGSVTWIIDNADIKSFYGGGINFAKPVHGNIHTIISNSYVDLFCGGPKFGDMESGRTVTTTATNCTFGTYFGAGYGGSSYNRIAPRNHNNIVNFPHNDNSAGNHDSWNNWLGVNYKQEYKATYGGVSTQFDYQFIPMSGNADNVARIFVDYVGFSLATTRNVTSALTGCTITGNFYGGGSLGKVDGNVTSTLDSCTVNGSVYGAGFSASLPTVEVDSIGFRTEPYYYTDLGTYRTGVKGQTTTYTWQHGNTISIDKTNHILYTTADLDALGTVTGKATLYIKGTTTVADSVFGGGEESKVIGDTEVTIQSGTVDHDVYGGGKEGEVGGNVAVNIIGGQVDHDVYGGGALAKANTAVTDGTYPTTTVNLLGGTIVGDAYGGGLGNDTTEADAGNTKVNLNGIDQAFYNAADDSLKSILDELIDKTSGSTDYYPLNPTLKGCIVNRIFGANNVNGSPKGDVTVHVFATQNKDATKATNITQKFVSDKVVNDALEDTDTPTLASLKAILADKIKVAKLTVLGINTDSYEATYTNATDTAAVRTAIKSITAAIDNAVDTDEKKAAVNALRYDVKAVYGGGNEAAYRPATPNTSTTATLNGSRSQVIIDGCDFTSIETVYGGGNAAAVPETNVDVNGAYEIEYVFGGGNGKDNKSNGDPNPGADVGIYNGSLYGTGNANTTIWGGTIHEVYGASNQKGNIKGSINLDVKQDGNSCPLTVEKVVGAGKNADIDGDIILVMGCMPATKTPLLFGGADNANVNGNVELTITSGTFGKVFGGNNLGGIIKGHIKVNIEETGCRAINIDELYLGGNEAAYSRFGYYDSGSTDADGRPIYLPRETADDSHTAVTNPDEDATHTFPYAQPVLNVISCSSIGAVFGGGLGTGAAMYADPTVNINMIQGDYADALPVDENNPNKLGAVENVYGGGNEAAVYGNTTVNIGTLIGQDITLTSRDDTTSVLGAYITGTVYGAGKGVEDDPAAAIVTGNTQVNMAGGHIRRSIYGGGELGSVGTFTEYYTTAESHPYHAVGEPKTCKAGTGLTEVKISGGQVGLVHQLMPDPNDPTSEDDYGYVFCASKGIADSTAATGSTNANLLAVSGSSYLEISGTPLIAASVYGGSENGQVLGDTHVKIMGGQIGSGYYKENGVNHWDSVYTDAQWTAAINAVRAGDEDAVNAAAAPFHECDAWPFGEDDNRHVYDHYANEYDSKGGATPGSDGHSYYGHVFGGGSGYYPFAPGKWRRTAGRVNGNTLVEITGGHILTNVYGGNEITDVLGKSKVDMSGGTVGVPRTLEAIKARPVNCYIFGAGMGDPRILFNGWSNVAEAEVIVRGDAVVFGSVFGGGEDGHVMGDVSTTIKGNAHIGTLGSSGVDGNIFGSGRGFSALALTAGAVCGNVTVDIQENAKILGSIFGGGRMAAVGTHLTAAGTANYGVLIPDGKEQVFGGDDVDAPGKTHGHVTVTITGGTIGNPLQLDNSQYSIGDVFGGSKGTLMDDWAKSQMLGLVKNTTVSISQDDDNYPTIIYGSVYGGGEIASVGSYNYATPADTTAFNPTHPSEPMAEGDVCSLREDNTGIATILITGGTIGRNSLADQKGNVFGGCLGRAGTGFSGYSFVNNSDVTLNGGTVYGSVFGGGENGHVMHDTNVKIKNGTVGIPLHDKVINNLTEPEKDNMIYRGNVYGGGRGTDKTSGGDYSITAGKVSGNTNVTVEGGTIYRNVYGGGSLASVGIRDDASDTNGLATVTIKSGQIGTDGGAAANNYNTLVPDRENRKENGFVFGSGRGMAAGAVGNETLVRLAYTKNTIVSIEGTGNVTGSVFGGGENGHVSANTKVYIKDSCLVGTELIDDEHTIDDNGRGRLLYRGNVYGGGRGIDKAGDGEYYSLTAGRVYGNTFVEVSGGKIYHDVFGGGSLASVGNETIDDTTGEISYSDDSGETEIHIKGGIIGYSSNAAKQGFNCGFVYGGCRGLSAPSNSDIVKMAYVHDAKVYIEPGADIKGSVFGGGANGHVKNDTYVEISGGSIGSALTAEEAVLDDHGVATKSIFRGNVYAGGRGVDQYSTVDDEKYSLSAGAVYGNAELKMTGGHIWHNIYGSGAMASVGTVEAKPANTHVHDEVVDTNGDLVDNVIYNPDESDINYLTGVFKANTGKVTLLITGGTVGDTTPGQEGINNGNVFGAGRGVSASRSDYVASMEFVDNTDVTIGTSGQTSYTGTDPEELNYPYIYGNVYGGGENGHVKTDTNVKIYSGIIGWPLVEGDNQEYKTAADGSSKNPYRGHVFGAGCGVDPLYHGNTETRSSTAGRVYGHTYVTMTGGVVRRAIYGGGLLASVGVYRLLQSDMHIIDMIEDEVDGGDATITISGGYVGNVDTNGSALGSSYLAPGDNNGHVFGSSCGMVADEYVEGNDSVDIQYRQMGYSHSTTVNISGDNTHIFGSVFGSGENGHVWQDSRINISGGEIGIEGNTSIYQGNVYGSGRGVDHPHEHISETAGKVRGNTTVNVTGGTIWRDVYGGGSLASVGEADEAADNSKKNVTNDPTTNNPFPYSSGLTRVVIDTTAVVHGSVYGSGRGVASTNAEYKQAAYVKNTLVTVKGSAHVHQNVFGGGNAGHVRKNTDVTIDENAKIDGNVYGGGAGDISSPTAGLVNHDVKVAVNGGLIEGDVYGGGAIANTNVHDVRNTAATDCRDTNRGNAVTEVNLTGGIILGDAYGGGQGVIAPDGATPAQIANAGALVQGDVTVTLNGTAFHPTTTNGVATSGRVFGCNNLNGTPQGTVLVHVLQTKGVTESGGTYTVNNTKPTKDTDTYEVLAVYGGGNLAAYEPWNANATGQYTGTGITAANKPVQVVIDGCDLTSIDYVYGGGNAANVPATQVAVLGSYEIGTVFGGGNGKDALPNGDPNPGAHVGYKADGTTQYGNGTSDVYLFGGTIHSAFGGSNTKGNIRGNAEVHIDEAMDGTGAPICPLELEEVYGGGNEAEMHGGSGIDLGCITKLKAIYGGAKNANVGDDIVLNITSGHYDRVFGGNNIGGTINGSITINIEETGCHPITIGELYGCGNQAAYTTPSGKTHPTVNIKSFTSIGRVFGGGLGASAIVTGHPIVNINEVLGLNAGENSTYAGASMTEAQRTRTLPDGTTVTLPAHTLNKIGAIGTVFGGGNAAKVIGNPMVNIGTLTTVDFVTKAANETQPQTGVTVVGADIRGNVFGGGNEAEVQGNSKVNIGKN